MLMPLPWFRFYTEFATDPKVQVMSEAMQRRLVMLFCARGSDTFATLRGDREATLAFYLHITENELAETKALFIEKGFIDKDWNLRNWEKRQRSSDSSAERVRQYRDKRESAGLPRNSGVSSDPILYERDGHRCIYCLSPRNLCIDHIYPISMGGTDHYDNLGVACKRCSSGKAGRTPELAKYTVQNTAALERYRRYVTVTGLPVTVSVTVSDCTEGDIEVEGEGEKEREQEQKLSDATHPHPAPSGEEKPNPAELIYQQYPHKVGHRPAIEAIGKAVERVRKGEGVTKPIPDKREAQRFLYRRVQEYARSPAGTRSDKEHIPHPTTWFNQSRYLDDENEWQFTGGENGKRKSTAQSKQDATVAACREAIARVRGVDYSGTDEDRGPDGGGDQPGATLFDGIGADEDGDRAGADAQGAGASAVRMQILPPTRRDR